MLVFAASSQAQEAYELKSLGHGIFTHCIQEVLSRHGAEISDGGRISAGRLMTAVEAMTQSVAADLLHAEQHPVKYNFGQDFALGLISGHLP